MPLKVAPWAGMALALAALIGYINHAATLRAAVEQTRAFALQQTRIADSVLIVARQKDSIIRTIEGRVVIRDRYIRVAAPRIDSVVAIAPDTCRPVIAVLRSMQDTLMHQLEDLRAEKDTLWSDNQGLLSALSGTHAALDSLVRHPIRPPARLWWKPRITVGVFAGYDPFGKTLTKGIGLGLGWSL